MHQDGHHVAPLAPGRLDLRERVVPGDGIAAGAELAQIIRAARTPFVGADAVHRDRTFFLRRDRVAIDADQRPATRIELFLVAIARGVDLRLEPAALDRVRHAAHGLDLAQPLEDLAFDAVGQRFDVPGAAERIDRLGDAGLVGEHLLRAQGDARRLLGRQSVPLVIGAEVDRLRAAEHRAMAS